ncbi:MAG: glycosyltransferase [Actinobacteria bacterium]|nr:glycosyltransferase [Actinomycetota bacterium]
MNNSDKLVSVIITTKNEAEVIDNLIQSLKRQTYKDLEIILIDNNSKDNTVRIAKKLGVKIYNFGPERSAQRNFGANKANGKFLFFLDADMKLSQAVVEECVKMCVSDKKIGALFVPEISVASNFWEKVKAFERSFYNEEGDNITDAARFFRRESFEKSGGYDETITGPEDWELTGRIKTFGYKTGRVRSVIHHYERINSLFSLVKKKFYYGLRSYRYLSKQDVPAISPKTIYFLRPVFYKHFDKIIAHPILSIGMFIMLTMELFAGGSGYLIGKAKKL